jgi:multidrug resistance protein
LTINQLPNPEKFKGGINRGKTEDDPYLVGFDRGDPANPKNWSKSRKWYLTMTGGLLILNATFASSAPSAIIPQLQEQFGFGREVGTLLLSLFVVGYCVGPLFWGPLSEQYGRRPIFLVSFLVYTFFQIGCALSPNTGSILAFRFLAGTFAAAPLSNSAGVIADIWEPKTRGTATAVFTLAPFAGPALAPAASGFMAVAGLSWRWLFWVMSIFAAVCWLQILFTLPETYAPVLLVEKAKRLREETGNPSYYAPFEKQPMMSLGKRVEVTLAKPFTIMFHEPMLIAIVTYMSFVYGCLYISFEAYPIIFTRGHHFNAGISGLMFLPLLGGVFFGVAVYLLVFKPRYDRAILEYAPRQVPPEKRLEVAIFAGPSFAIAFFWLAWTSNPKISFWAPMMSGFLLGWSILWIMLGLMNYIIDSYLFVAASVLAAVTVCRSLAGAAFPLFATQMYEALGTEWASSLLGFVALGLMPIPFFLMKFGPRLRLNSKYAPSKPIAALKEKQLAGSQV